MRKTEASRDPETIAHGQRMIVDRLDWLEAELGDKPYFLSTFGLTDIGLWPRLSRIEEYGAMDSGKHPELRQWLGRMLARPLCRQYREMVLRLYRLLAGRCSP